MGVESSTCLISLEGQSAVQNSTIVSVLYVRSRWTIISLVRLFVFVKKDDTKNRCETQKRDYRKPVTVVPRGTRITTSVILTVVHPSSPSVTGSTERRLPCVLQVPPRDICSVSIRVSFVRVVSAHSVYTTHGRRREEVTVMGYVTPHTRVSSSVSRCLGRVFISIVTFRVSITIVFTRVFYLF